jgi:hypothetical protein
MPDNVGYTPGTGATVAADEIAGVLYQRVKTTFGADGTATDVSAADPLPVADAGVSAKLPALSGGRLPIVLPESQTTGSGAVLTGTARDRFFWNAGDFDLVNEWQVFTATALGGALTEQTSIGSAYPNGMTITGPLGGNAAGATPYLNIASGTASGAQTVILSRSTLKSPVDLRYQISASQRIANNTFRIGFLQCDEAGNLVTATTPATATAVLNARNAAMAQWTGATATTGGLITRAAGSAIETLATAYGTGFTTVATGSAPDWIAASAFGLSMERDKVNARGYTLNVLTNAGTDFGIDRVLPNPTNFYRLAIIVENSAVVTTTDWRVHLVNLLDSVRFDVGPRYTGKDRSKAMPVDLLGSVGLTAAVSSITSASPTIYTDTATNLALNATFTGTSRDAGATAVNQRVAATFVADQASETDGARIEFSTDNTNWRRAAQATLAANAPVQLSVFLTARYWRVVLVNGGVAQTQVLVTSGMYRI